MIKIGIAGIGGVGGYFGGLLARHYQGSSEVEIYFIARENNKKTIARNGLQLETTKGNFTAFPKLVTSDPLEIDVLDLLICCVKSYDLDECMLGLKPCIDPKTIMLPLLNGVDSSDRIKALYPNNEVWDGCVYIVSRLITAGLIKQSGNISLLYFGCANGTTDKLRMIEKILVMAGIEAALSDNIQQTMWEKFLFISPIATLTSYLDIPIGQILAEGIPIILLSSLLKELKSVAKAKGIELPQNIIAKVTAKMASLPYETTTSMHDDFKQKRKTELESLTGYVVRSAIQLKVEIETYVTIYEDLKSRAQLKGVSEKDYYKL